MGQCGAQCGWSSFHGGVLFPLFQSLLVGFAVKGGPASWDGETGRLGALPKVRTGSLASGVAELHGVLKDLVPYCQDKLYSFSHFLR